MRTTSVWATTTGLGEEPAGLPGPSSVRLRLLGAGGQGEVWLVEHLGRHEAHKYLTRRGPAAGELFREALHTRLVDHPNIVQVFGTEEVDGAPVLRMEFVEGIDLAQAVERDGVLPLDRLVPVAIQIADALQATHEAGIVHQDLKPSNLILRADGTSVVVTDFGVSAAARSGSAGVGGGTPMFMAPEQFEDGSRGTARSDVWSLGVTLYYLACGRYPFPFETLAPREAVREPPLDPTPDHPWVPTQLWAILRRMLRADPSTEGYATVREAREDLEAWWTTLRCPACGRPAPLDEIEEGCPRPECGSPELALTRTAVLARRGAQAALANCSFPEAVGLLRGATEELSGEGRAAAAGELAGLQLACERLARDHGRAVEEVGEQLEAGRIVEAVRGLERARALFSRSPALGELRSRARRAVVEVHSATEPGLRDALRSGDFERAREVLSRLTAILDDAAARRELRLGLGHPPEDPDWLAEEVERREGVWRVHAEGVRRAIDALDLGEAVRCAARLQSEFPSEENERALGRLRRAERAWAAARSWSVGELEALAEAPLDRAGERPLELRAAREACDRLLEDLPAAEHPSLERVRELHGLLDRAIAAVEERVGGKLERAERSQEELRVVEALSLLDRVGELVLGSDVFASEAREAFRARRSHLAALVERASGLHRDGQTALERRDYAAAHLALQELVSLAPRDFPDVEGMLEEIERLRGRAAVLGEDVARSLADIRRGRFSLDSIRLTLERAEELHRISGDDRRRELLADLAEAAVGILDSQLEYARSLREAAEACAFLRSSLVPVVQALPAERWGAMAADHPEVASRLACLLDQAASLLPDEAAQALAVGGELCSALEELADLPSRGPSEPTAPCAADRIASAVEAGLRAAGSAAVRPQLPAALDLLRRLEAQAPGERAADVRRRAERLRRLGRRATLARSGRRLLRTLLWLGPLAAAGIGGWMAGHDRGVRAAEGEIQGWTESWVGGLGLDRELERAAAAWLGSSADEPAGSAERMAVAQRWKELRRALAGHDSGERRPLGYWVAAGSLLGQVDRLEGEPWEGLRRRFVADVDRALEVTLGLGLERALAEPWSAATPGGAHGGLPALLADVIAGLPPGAERQGLERLRAAIAELVGEAPVAELRAALDAGRLPGRASSLHAGIRALCAEGGAAGGFSDGVRFGLRGWLQGELRRILSAELLAELEAAAGGRLEGFAARQSQLVRALDELPRGLAGARALSRSKLERTLLEVVETLGEGGGTE